IGVFSKDNIANIVDKVILGDFHPSCGGAGSFHPYLSVHGVVGGIILNAWSCFEGRDSRGGRSLDEDERTLSFGIERSGRPDAGTIRDWRRGGKSCRSSL